MEQPLAKEREIDYNRIKLEVEAQINEARIQQEKIKSAKDIPTDTKMAAPIAQPKQQAVVPVPKKKIQKPLASVDDESLDYSHLYSSFYDIFVGYQTSNSSFDVQYAMRENRNIYATFVNLMEGAHAVLMQ